MEVAVFSNKKIWFFIVGIIVIASLISGIIFQLVLLPEMRANKTIEERKQTLETKQNEQAASATQDKKTSEVAKTTEEATDDSKATEAANAPDAKKATEPEKEAYVLIDNPNPDSALIDLDQFSHIKNENYYGTVPLLISQGSGTTYQVVGPKVTLIKSGTLKKLIMADQLLYEKGYRIVVYCAYRDEALQKYLRQHYENTTLDYDGGFNYVAAVGASRHQRGQAVDIAIESLDGKREEPTPYLTFTSDITVKANEDNVVLKILQDAMLQSGFQLYNGEWWHFDDKNKY